MIFCGFPFFSHLKFVNASRLTATGLSAWAAKCAKIHRVSCKTRSDLGRTRSHLVFSRSDLVFPKRHVGAAGVNIHAGNRPRERVCSQLAGWVGSD